MQWIKIMLIVLLAVVGSAALLLAVFAFLLFFFASRRLARLSAFPLDPKVYGPYLPEMERGAAWFAAQPAEAVSIRSADGLRLAGRVLPAENAVGTMLLMHGYRATGVRDFSCVLRFYHEQGYNIVLPDERACGESEGKYITFGVKEREDCQLWAEYAAARFGTELPLFLDGVSMGAATVLMATALALPQNVRGVIADCGFTSPMAIIGAVAKKALGCCPAFVLRLSSFFAGCIGGWRYDACSAADAMRQNKNIPVFFAHGEKDDFVPVSMTLENHAACAAEKELFLAPEAGHGLSYLVERERCEAALLCFLARYGGEDSPQ